MAAASISSNGKAMQVNSEFEGSEEAMMRAARGVSEDLSCMMYPVAGMFIVTFRVVISIVSVITIISALLANA